MTSATPAYHGAFETHAIHGHQPPCPATGAVIPPLYQVSTFALDGTNVPNSDGYFYTRMGNPTINTLEKLLGDLEGARYSMAFGSGMGAISCVLLTVVKPGDHVIAEQSVYGGTAKLFEKVMKDFQVEFTLIDLQDVQALQNALRPNTRLLYWESVTNPCLKVLDVTRLTQFAKANNLITCVDNTFATPALQTPLAQGVDIVLHSVTKYIGGHSDILAGAVMTNHETLGPQLRLYQECLGATPDPFCCWLTLRGLKTLKLRMRQHCANAMQVATFLSQHPAVEAVHYPGLPADPGHQTAQRQMSDFGGMVSFKIRGDQTVACAFLEHLKLFTTAVSLGGVESLVCHPGATMYKWATPETKERIGVTPNLIRLSIGLEAPEDLIHDLDQALRATVH